MNSLEDKIGESKAYKSFVVSISLSIILCVIGVFFGMAIRNNALIHETLLSRARSLFQAIVLTRTWNANYGGVFVFKAPGVESNPWLINPDIQTADGRTLTKRNPALMTREISEIASRQAQFRFHITSLKPLNPGNEADYFEEQALTLFETGKTETWSTIKENGESIFRYMGALRTDAACLQCHAVQGYKEGDIRGGISVSFSVDAISRAQLFNTIVLMATGGLVSIGLLWIVLRFFGRLKGKLDKARKELMEIAIRDGLTGLFNRRHIMDRFEEELVKAKRTSGLFACALVDVDNFKKVNDELGHLTGDLVLKHLARIMDEETRPYDLIGRYGGEEFLLIFPSATLGDVHAACERIRIAVAGRLAKLVGFPARTITISIGISDMGSGTSSCDEMVGRADAALYQAKSSGKNCCVS